MPSLLYTSFFYDSLKSDGLFILKLISRLSLHTIPGGLPSQMDQTNQDSQRKSRLIDFELISQGMKCDNHSLSMLYNSMFGFLDRKFGNRFTSAIK